MGVFSEILAVFFLSHIVLLPTGSLGAHIRDSKPAFVLTTVPFVRAWVSHFVHTCVSQREVKQAIKEAAPNGVDIVIDMVGADVLEPAVRSLNWSGRAVVIGFAGGSIPKIPTNLLLVKNVSVSGLFWGAHMIHEPKTLLKSANQLVEWWAEGRITPHVCARVPLKEANKAFELLEGRTSVGKVVLVPN